MRRPRFPDPVQKQLADLRYYANNRDRIKTKAAEYWRANRDQRLAYSRNRREIYRAQRLARVRALRIWVNTNFKSCPCTDCGGRFPPDRLDFDHVRGPKVLDLCKMVARGYKRSRIVAEIAKCELVCRRCHDARGNKRRLAGLKELTAAGWSASPASPAETPRPPPPPPSHLLHRAQPQQLTLL
jgi:hypothetical protein